MLTHYNNNGWLDLQTSDYLLDGEIWKIRLFMKSLFSKLPVEKSEGAHVFEIEFRDICWDSTLYSASFDNSATTYDVW